MPPPLEQLLVNRCGIKYHEARQVVSDARKTLGMSCQSPWNRELYDKCLELAPPSCPTADESRAGAAGGDEQRHQESGEATAEVAPLLDLSRASTTTEKPKYFKKRNENTRTPPPVNRPIFQRPHEALTAFRSGSGTALDSFRSLCRSFSGEGKSIFPGNNNNANENRTRRASTRKQAGEGQQEPPQLTEKLKEPEPQDQKVAVLSNVREAAAGVEPVKDEGRPLRTISVLMKREQRSLFPTHSGSAISSSSSHRGHNPSTGRYYGRWSSIGHHNKKRGGTRRLLARDDDDDDEVRDMDSTSFSTEHSDRGDCLSQYSSQSWKAAQQEKQHRSLYQHNDT